MVKHFKSPAARFGGGVSRCGWLETLRRMAGGAGRGTVAFTLLEMLVVISIMGIVAALAIPSIKNISGGNVITAASRQLMDDLNLARLRAINGRTTVYVVFMPSAGQVLSTNTLNPLVLDVLTQPGSLQSFFDISPITSQPVDPAANALLGGQFTAYALFVKRNMGDQLGRDTAQYLTGWRFLPEGIHIEPTWMTNSQVFFNVPAPNVKNPYIQLFPCPSAGLTNVTYDVYLPFLAFDSQGRLLNRNADVRIPLCKGSVSTPRYPNKAYMVADANPREIPPNQVNSGEIQPGGIYYLPTAGTVSILYNNTIYNPGDTFFGVAGQFTWTPPGSGTLVKSFEGVSINWLTGRSRLLRQELR